MFKFFTIVILMCAILESGEAGKGKKSSTSASTCSSSKDSNNWNWYLGGHGWWKRFRKGKDVSFSAGHMISCNIPGQNYVVVHPKHYMLATGSDTVAHSWGFGNSSVIREESWTSGPSNLRNFFCDQKCWVREVKGNSDAIQNARNSVRNYGGRTVYYDLLTCNCEHWVRYWNFGNAYSHQSARWSGSKCAI